MINKKPEEAGRSRKKPAELAIAGQDDGLLERRLAVAGVNA
jgi:hypothetical protein